MLCFAGMLGSEEQKQKYLPSLARFDTVGCWVSLIWCLSVTIGESPSWYASILCIAHSTARRAWKLLVILYGFIVF
jgi:hypothetical protein